MNINPFKTFDLDENFSIDLTKLHNKFLELQKLYHPDLYAHKSEIEKQESIIKSSQIDDAYNLLKNPITRAEYLLSKHIEVNHHKNKLDIDFLTLQMNLRQKLEQIQHSANYNDFQNLQENNNELYKKIIDNLEKLLNEKNWLQAHITVDQLKFIHKMQIELNLIEEKVFL